MGDLFFIANVGAVGGRESLAAVCLVHRSV